MDEKLTYKVPVVLLKDILLNMPEISRDESPEQTFRKVPYLTNILKVENEIPSYEKVFKYNSESASPSIKNESNSEHKGIQFPYHATEGLGTSKILELVRSKSQKIFTLEKKNMNEMFESKCISFDNHAKLVKACKVKNNEEMKPTGADLVFSSGVCNLTNTDQFSYDPRKEKLENELCEKPYIEENDGCLEKLPSKEEMCQIHDVIRIAKEEHQEFSAVERTSGGTETIICCTQFTDEKSLTEHENTHTVSGLLQGQEDGNEINCIENVEDSDTSFSDITSPSKEATDDSFVDLLICEICDKVFTRKCILKTHMRTHVNSTLYPKKEWEKQYSERKFRESQVGTHLQGDNTKKFFCDKCSKGFSVKFNLTEHLNNIHVGQFTYKCNYCSKYFCSKSKFNWHLKYHFDVNRFTCDICKRKFRDRYGLEKHYMRFHSSIKQFACTVCCREFSTKTDLTTHIKRNRNHRSKAKDIGYYCEKCGRRYSHPESLKRHLVVHSDTKEFECKECTKRYYRKETLNKHMNTHTRESQFTCIECCKEFSCRFSLTQHMITIHSEVKRTFSCPICLRSFSKKGYLSSHLRSHSKSPFQCTTCRQIFNKKGNFMNHVCFHFKQRISCAL